MDGKYIIIAREGLKLAGENLQVKLPGKNFVLTFQVNSLIEDQGDKKVYEMSLIKRE